MPLDNVPDSENYHGFFPAKHVANYLKTYVERKVFDEWSLASRICFRSIVDTITKVEGGWTIIVKLRDEKGETTSEVTARKVIDATGLNSSPHVPILTGANLFKGITFHSIDFARNQEALLHSEVSQSIVVVGGAKSAGDIAYACAKAGHKVSWVIRRSGAGPAAFASTRGRGLYKNSNESFYTRFTSHFLVSYFFDESKTWLGRFLYKTGIGRRLVRKVWKGINATTQDFADYNRADGKENGFFNLRPDTEIFWQNDSTGICQRPDFFDTIAHNVKVYREDIKMIIENGLGLADGTYVGADVIIFATGWKPSHPKMKVRRENGDAVLSLGIFEAATQRYSKSQLRWAQLESSAEKKVLTRFQILRDRPKHYLEISKNTTPLRLYKGILPINDRSIAFVGQILLGNNFRVAEVQALYAVAALDGTLALPTTEKVEATIAETIAWDRLRYLAKGELGNWAYWDMVPYTDDLLQELDLTSHRHGSYWKDLFAPCYASDLRRLIDEYKSKYGTL